MTKTARQTRGPRLPKEKINITPIADEIIFIKFGLLNNDKITAHT